MVLIRLSTFGRVRTVRATQLALIGGSILLLGLTSHSIAQIRVGPGGVEIGPREDERPREVERPREFDRRPPPRDELRDRMFRLREACEDGDKRACVRLGVIIGENRERRGEWRRDHPELFFFER